MAKLIFQIRSEIQLGLDSSSVQNPTSHQCHFGQIRRSQKSIRGNTVRGKESLGLNGLSNRNADLCSTLTNKLPDRTKMEAKCRSLVMWKLKAIVDESSSHQQGSDSHENIGKPHISRASRRKFERRTYLIAAIVSSVGITSLAAGAVVYRFMIQLQVTSLLLSSFLGVFPFWIIWY